MAETIERVSTPCGAFGLEPASRAPVDDAVAALVCAALADGSLPRETIADCKDLASAWCAIPYADFMPCY
jgi:hypothetical protein